MIKFEVELNDEAVHVAGAENLSVLTAIISAVGRLGNESKGARGGGEGFILNISGLTSSNHTQNEHVDWVSRT